MSRPLFGTSIIRRTSNKLIILRTYMVSNGRYSAVAVATRTSRSG
ncbi:14509_t:CDS:2, partial [Entrophospora sp. SA101]